jgi:hypothetical protein
MYWGLSKAFTNAHDLVRANEMLVSIPAAGRKTSTSTFRSRSSDALRRPGEDFQTSTPLNSVRAAQPRSKHLPPDLSTPSSSYRSPLPRFPSPRIHKRTRPRVSLGDFHDQPPNLIDAEHEFSRTDPSTEDHGIAEEASDFLRNPAHGASPFSPFPLAQEDDLDEKMDTSSFLTFDPIGSTRHKFGQKKPAIELESHVEAEECDTYSLAKCYFDTKELERCKRALQGCRSKKAVFLRLYSVYLVSVQVTSSRSTH